MRVALLSYHHAYNYGAVFQIAALQHVIKSLGHHCDIIDYRCNGIESQYSLRKLNKPLLFLQDLRANLVLAPFITRKKENFEHWFSMNDTTRTIKNKEELISLNGQYDKFIVGSDQVWNLKCNKYDDSFLLDFVTDNNKKISYAASFGQHDIPSDWEPHFSRFIPQFSSISVREERGSEIVSRYCDTPAPCAMDPVLLVGKEFWMQRKSQKLIQEPYLFVYHLGHGSLIPQYISSLRNKIKRVVFVTGHSGNMLFYRIGDKNMSSASPEDFLSLLFYSEHVVTNSFHATALSVLFSKKLSVVTKGGQTESYNSRVFSLLERYNLSSFIVSEPFDNISDNQSYNFEFASRLEADRQQSIEFLKSSISK